jgi:hypothetical protein
MKKITKREIIAFLLGIFAMFLFETIYDWEGTKKSFLCVSALMHVN